MRQFARPFPLERLSLEARVLYTAFLVFLAAGIGSSIWLYASSFGGLAGDAAATYYLGSEAPPPVQPADAGGPDLDLPDDLGGAADPVPAGLSGSGMRLGQSGRQVMETFHFHLFTVPVVLLIVGHLFMLTALSVRLKIAVIAVASVATFVHLLSPLLVRFVGAGFGPLVPASVVVAALGWLPMVLWPLWEMWRRLPEKKVESALS
ncbi:hypothetical protein [Vulgatibacter incomptus]|uniref:Uncharacterized protein n=1 Tax=Vulgatibacter incomptus TaxID=1391653 RepID=A0A0K1PD88_9BACT|nr:hypothetical protein [Vulgatibacter incomptus]AKU91084.1 hypothetical protein AKJ08_1471 [Vulgatibacter incomptus]